MTYIERKIAKRLAESKEFRVAFEEEVQERELEKERRVRLMSTLANVRKKKGLSQSQVAKLLNVSQSRISQIESGRESVSVDHLLKLVEILGAQLSIASPEAAPSSRA